MCVCLCLWSGFAVRSRSFAMRSVCRRKTAVSRPVRGGLPVQPYFVFTRDIASGLNEAPLLHSPYIAVDLTSFSYAVCFVPCVTRDPPPGR